MKIFPLQIIPNDTSFDFIKLRKYTYALSLIVILLGIFFIFFKQANIGVEFTGGTHVEIEFKNKVPDINEIRSVILKRGIICNTKSIGKKGVLFQIQGSNLDVSNKKIEDLKVIFQKKFSKYDVNYYNIEFVGPQVTNFLIFSCIKSVLLTLIGISIYVWLRFKFYFGITAFLTLLHNLLITFFFLYFFNLEISQSTIAAFLILLGYSINDSIVIYDNIQRTMQRSFTFILYDVLNLSINKTLSRTFYTSLTTLIANLVIIFFGGKAIFDFGLTIFIGICVGTYTSIMFSAPLLYDTKKLLYSKS